MEMEVSETKSETFKKYGRKLTEQEQDWYETYALLFVNKETGRIPDGDCPECYFNDEILKETIIDDPDWIDKSKLH